MANEITCTRCGVTKEVEQFTKREKRCRPCRALIARERWQRIQADPERYVLEKKKRKAYYEVNRERWKETYETRRAAGWRRDPAYIREYRLQREYGLTLAEYDAMLAGQHGVCAICGKTESVAPNMPVDHDHQTGKVRALLCTPCNTVLGLAAESPDRLRAMAAYLETHS